MYTILQNQAHDKGDRKVPYLEMAWFQSAVFHVSPNFIVDAPPSVELNLV